MNSIEVEKVSKSFQTLTAVHELDLVLSEGECIALAGHNGAGKSTLMKMMLGLMPPTSGAIRLYGNSPRQHIIRSQIGYLPETVSLYPALTGLETLAFFAKLKKLPTNTLMDLLELVGIADAAHQRVRTYSKGMRQRLALAQTLLGEPKLLFFDEPTTGLDPASRLQFYELLSLLRKRGASIVMSTHALSELQGQIDRIVIMKKGCKVADGTLDDLRAQSELPTKLTVTVSEEKPLAAPWQKIGVNKWQCDVKQSEKMSILAALFTHYQPTGLDMLLPSLDDLYAHFLKRESGNGGQA